MEAEAQGRPFSVLLQNAETVRLVGAALQARSGADGCSGSGIDAGAELRGAAGAISVCALKPGDLVMAHVPEMVGRHTGTAVDETILERCAGQDFQPQPCAMEFCRALRVTSAVASTSLCCFSAVVHQL